MEEIGENEEQRMKPEIKTKLKASETKRTDEDVKRHEAYNVSPRGGGGSGSTMGKSSSGRFNCLCAPTTHAGSFRCRYHRRSARMPRGVSVPTNLSMMGASKP